MSQSATAWAQEEFGASCLGDERRVRRLVRVAADAARRPSGTIAGTLKGAARREAAFRWVENDAVSVEAVAEASHRAAARRCSTEDTVIVPIDQTSLSIPDRTGTRGFGPIAPSDRPTTGIHVMSALAVGRFGQPIGLLAQQWWVRSRTRVHRSKSAGGQSDRRPREARESFHWVECLRRAEAHLQAEAPGCRGWYQLDRGGDCLVVLAAAVDENLVVTIRAEHSRRLTWPNRSIGHLKDTICRQPVSGYYECDVPKRPKQTPRRARLAVRYLKAPLSLRLLNDRRRTVWMTAVYVTEVGAPAGQQPVCWLLLTNRTVATLHDALRVVAAYALRWRIEDFHKTWKSGACAIESSQLRAPDHLVRWATIMASIAARIERIKHQSRNQSELPATAEYTQDEIDATIVLRANETRVAYKPGDVPTLGEVTRWIADLGGYMGSRRSPPPGSVVLRRGLEQVAAAAIAIKALREGRSG